MFERPTITVNDLLMRAPSRLAVQVIAGRDGLESKVIDSARIQKLGLALAGFTHYIHAGRIQIVGQSEIWYLEHKVQEERRDAIRNLALERITCLLVTKNLTPPIELIEASDKAGVPLLLTPVVSSDCIGIVTEFLHHELAPRENRHGVLLDLYGLGVLLEGQSGIGKSECALDLITRGHRLVADDVVEVRRIAPERLVGDAPELLREHLEIRGLGILNIRELFGVSAMSGAKQIDLSIRLERWDECRELDRLGVEQQTIEILDCPLPRVLLPVSPGRNLSTLVETATRVHLQRSRGYDAARDFVERHERLLARDEEKNFARDEQSNTVEG